MRSPVGGANTTITDSQRSRRIPSWLLLLGFVLGAILIATLAFCPQFAFAAGPDQPVQWQSAAAANGYATIPADSGFGPQSDYAAKAISPVDPSQVGEQGNADCGEPPPITPVQQEDEEIWTATLTVGEATDSFLTYRGYIPGNFPDEGDLVTTTFKHGDVEYEVLGLYVQETIADFRQLVLFTDKPLPDGWTLTLDDDEFPVSSERLLGGNTRIYGWPLEDSLGWTVGQLIEVAMLVDSE